MMLLTVLVPEVPLLIGLTAVLILAVERVLAVGERIRDR